MELDLQRTMLEGYQQVFNTVLTQEEVTESIVPDSYPDVSRIVCSVGEAYLTSKQIGSGNVKVIGTARVNVLYVPEGESSPRAITLSLPIQCSGDYPQIKESDMVHCSVLSSSVESRLVNPRKLFIKGEFKINLRIYSRSSAEVVCDLADEKNDTLQKLQMEYKHHTISAVLEKPFLFTDTLRQSASKPVMEELLYCQTYPGTVEGRYIGKKLVCKGEMNLCALYRSGKEIMKASFELPFSQVLELEGNFDEGEPDVAIMLKNVECYLKDGELEVAIEALIQATLWSHHNVVLLRDVYSTAVPMDVERNLNTLCSSADKNSRKEAVRKFCESGIPAKQVLNSTCYLSQLAVQARDGGAEYATDASIDILYLSEDDAMCCVHYTIPVVCNIEFAQGWTCDCSCRPIGEVIAVPVTGGFEVRLEVDFIWQARKYEAVPSVSAVKESKSLAGNEPKPSLVIRRVMEGETLWDVAKSCGATIHDICTANEMTAEVAVPGSMLLIPTKR